MPGSVYLQSVEYAAYGLPSSTTAQQVGEASTYLDGWLKRPEGLVWSPDAAQNPAYMAAAVPTAQFTLAAPIATGANVQVNVTGPLGTLNIGDSVIADRANTNMTEACVVTAKSGGLITLGNVAYAHSGGMLLETGLAITERKSMPNRRPLMMVSRRPVQRILSGKGRYAYSRRGDAHSGNTDDFNLLAVYSQFGGPPAWEMFNPAVTEFDPRTGQVWVPAGIMLAYYTEVEMTYVAGFSAATLPNIIKEACAKIVKALQNDPELGPVKSYRAGDTAVTLFTDSILSGDLKSNLIPYRAMAMA